MTIALEQVSTLTMGMRTQLALWFAITAIAAVVAASYGAVNNGNPWIGGTIGALIGGMLIGVEIFVIQRPVGAALRRLPILLFTLTSSVIWLALIYVGLQLGPALHGLSAYGDHYTATTLTQDMAFAFGISFLLNAALRVRSLVGPRVLSNFLVGRYYRPLREDRIFMFLDLANSTALAERLGDLQVQYLIRRFFFDVSEPVVRFGGETHRYIGDEVVVTWPLCGDKRDQRCIACVFAIRERISKHAESYRQHYGVVPEFRVGMHGGSVVASEIGEDKREIVYFGDSINTAARLGAACKTTDSKFLVSAALIELTGLPPNIIATPVGALALAGKGEPVDALSLSLSSSS